MSLNQYEILSVDMGDLTASIFKMGVVDEFSSGDGADSHFHTVYELQYICRGSVLISGDREDFWVQEGDFVIIPPGTFHHNEKQQGLSRYTLLFSLTSSTKKHKGFSEYCYYSRILESLCGIRVFRCRQAEEGIRRILNLKKLSEENRHLQNLYLPLILTDVLLSLEAEMALREEESALPEKKSFSREEERMKFIIENCIQEYFASEGIAVALADALGMSRRNCARVVQRLLGKPLSHLVLEHRMNMAYTLIRRTSRPLGQIAEAVGFRTYVSFFTAFKKFYGTSPQQIRENGGEKGNGPLVK